MNCAMIDSAEGTRDAAACAATAADGNGMATEVLYEYGLQVLLLTVLVPITIFRRQISCNAEHREPAPSVSPSIMSISISGSTSSSATAVATATSEQTATQWDDEEADSLLERASTCYGYASYHVLEDMLGRFLQIVLPSRLACAVLNFLTQWWLVAAQHQCLDDILDGAEYWRTSPPPANILIVAHSQDPEGKLQFNRQERECAIIFPNAPEHLPSDVTAHILSFLHPKDVLAFGSVSPAAQVMVRNDAPIWKSLWMRDYAWLVTSWHVGREALQRSWQSLKAGTGTGTTGLDQNQVVAQLWNSFHFTKDFYFRFGICWVDYVLAGQCTAESCLIALGGHVYDLTHFVQDPHTHPGSAETVLVHAGKDCTAVFDGMRHTIHARRMAQQMCVAVDLSRNNNNNQRGLFGVRPTSQLLLDQSITAAPAAAVSAASVSTTAVSVIPHGRPQGQAAATAATAEAVRHEVLQELSECTVRARRMKDTGGVPDALSELHTYYDPFAGKWKAWYLGASFEPVFVEDIIVTTSSAMSFLFG